MPGMEFVAVMTDSTLEILITNPKTIQTNDLKNMFFCGYFLGLSKLFQI
ncbi:MAG: hypothetical protein GY737_06660 [Desulfobacteraceae bacterium]|nr:hypothetical protein [Desulfobacteraceae bacterium]